ncbi:nonribosomal peptide synthetase [Phlyctema vagabunda]|uniref:Nonribosomal peptide synthetase n=1 Tax=Phlyctema vagabunda TaxID=108571 RepID=A0ABR4PUD6_9HELO
MSPPNNLFELLRDAAQHGSFVEILSYETVAANAKPISITYQKLLEIARTRSRELLARKHIEDSSIVLLQVDHHFESLLWFWAIIAAGLIPCISAPLTKDLQQRKKHVRHLQELLQDPHIITTEDLIHEFPTTSILNLEHLRTQTADQSAILTRPAVRIDKSHDDEFQDVNDPELENSDSESAEYTDRGCGIPEMLSQSIDLLQINESSAACKRPDETAVLMLTSGSTGNAKAVPLRHGQILQAIKGKSMYHGTTKSDVFMNWVGLDHVANLSEIHLQAMSLYAQQIHLPKDVVTDPLCFLDLIEKHKISYTFGPNFFLKSITGALINEQGQIEEAHAPIRTRDLSSLKALISGGESNVVDTCVTLTQLLKRHHAPESFIRPGFGMTETCAGSIYSKNCPKTDIMKDSEFASLGHCISGIAMRIVRQGNILADVDEVGALEVKGPIVFQGYYNNDEATSNAFTEDQWFRTGDLARLDGSGALHITGREKETLLINGVNHSPQAIEAAIEESQIPGIKPSYTVVFSHRPRDSPTESLCIVYLPNFEDEDVSSRISTTVAISKAITTYCGVRPYKIIPLDSSRLVKSSLGKLSRMKIRKAFEAGEYKIFEDRDSEIIKARRLAVREAPSTETQSAILDACRDVLGGNNAEFGIGNSLFELGPSSIDLLRLSHELRIRLQVELPLYSFFAYPIIKILAQEIENMHKVNRVYEPVVTLQAEGENIPLWLIHPGVGEVLIFLNLARHFTDRPVYALRARGFDGEPYFESMEEIIDTYLGAIKRVQLHGPYAICGYSFGSILTFELTKRLESCGDEVKFVGVLDQPPHFKKRAAGYDWYEVACTLAFFLELIEEDYAYDFLAACRLNHTPHEEVTEHIFMLAPMSRLQGLGLTEQRFENWANLAFQLKIISRDYDPSGMITKMDVFYVPPLPIVEAKTTQQWLDDFIGKWQSFTHDVKFHFVEGGHRTLISPPHVSSFQRVLKDALRERGI